VKNRVMIVKNVALQRQRRNAVHLIAVRVTGLASTSACPNDGLCDPD
jgi:hypothetical protein